ncbi:MAG TPA: cellulase N-terminal Ig-like domain-containing protein [Candidatus Sumerlaeota bacterium]|nr:cellulase N-terminal Ig-like domain-containing protein [Candidatus Sumerlaeota bacterium]
MRHSKPRMRASHRIGCALLILFAAATARAGQPVLFSEDFEGRPAGEALHGTPLNNGLGGQVAATWWDPKGLAHAGADEQGGRGEIAPGGWDHFKTLIDYELDPDEAYAFELELRPPGGVLQPTPWNPHSGLVILSRKDTGMMASGVVLRIQGPDPSGKDPNRFTLVYQREEGNYFDDPALIGDIVAEDYNAAGVIPTRIEFSGRGTAAHPLVGRLLLNGRERGSFVIPDLFRGGRYIGLVTQSSPKEGAAPGLVDNVKLERLEAPVFNPAPRVAISPVLLPVAMPELELTAFVCDDGPTDRLRLGWEMIDGPAAATFSDSGRTTTRVTFAAPGLYTLGFSAFDGEHRAEERLSLVVAPPPSEAPLAEAGFSEGEPLAAKDALPGQVLTRPLPLAADAGHGLRARWRMAPPSAAGWGGSDRIIVALTDAEATVGREIHLVPGDAEAAGPAAAEPAGDRPSPITLPIAAAARDELLLQLDLAGTGTPRDPLRGRLLVNQERKLDFDAGPLAADVRLSVAVVTEGGAPVQLDDFELAALRNPFVVEDFMLLYSTLGYDSRASKRALVRLHTRSDAESLDAEASSWRLLNQEGEPVLSGPLMPLPKTFGCLLWEAEFSSWTTPGTYSLEVTLVDRDAGELAPLVSEPFLIEPRLHYQRTFEGIALLNAEARRATEDVGGGYYDCNSAMGEAYSHGAFLAGLSKAYQRFADDLTLTDRDRLREAANRAADYLMLLHNAQTGEIICQHPNRVQGAESGDGPHNTFEGIWGLLNYAVVFKDLEPARALDAFNRSRKSYQWLGNQGIYYPDQASAFMALIHQYQPTYPVQETLFRTLNDFLREFNPRQWGRSCGRCIPYFEGLWYCLRTFPDHPDRSRWESLARDFNQQWYQEMMQRNAFHILPQGGAREWDNTEDVPPEIYPPYNFYASTQFGTMATDAILLARITGDDSLERMATGCLNWITGLHPGVPRNSTLPAATGRRLTAAALIMNLPGARHIRTWTYWGWEQPEIEYLSIVNGLCIDDGDWYYSTREWRSGETFIKHDGAYLYAMALYDQYLEENRSGVTSLAQLAQYE